MYSLSAAAPIATAPTPAASTNTLGFKFTHKNDGQVTYRTITYMDQYKGFSLEELHLLDLIAGFNPSTAPAAAAATAAPAATGGLFGNTPAAGGLFGTNAPAVAAAVPAAGGGLFGATAAPAATAGGGLFGNAAPAAAGGLFGNTAQPATTAGGLFGKRTTVRPFKARGKLFYNMFFDKGPF